MLVKVTGGMSRVVGARYPAAPAEAFVCGTSPVRTMGGCSSVEMAFWLVSRTLLPRRVGMSKLPPIEGEVMMLLAALPLLGLYRLPDADRSWLLWEGKG